MCDSVNKYPTKVLVIRNYLTTKISLGICFRSAIEQFAIIFLLTTGLMACQSSPAVAPTSTLKPTSAIAFSQTPTISTPEPTQTASPTRTSTPPPMPTAVSVFATPLTSAIKYIPPQGELWVTSNSPESIWIAETTFSEGRILLQVQRTDDSLTWLAIDKEGAFSADDPYPSIFSWSADGRYLYYYGTTGRYFFHPGYDEECDIQGINVDPQRLDLASGEIVSLTTYQPGELEEFSISLQAGTFAYFDPDRTKNELKLQNLVTNEAQKVSFEIPVDEDWTVGQIVWAPDERALAFSVVASPCNQTGIYPTSVIVVDVKSGLARTVISGDPHLNPQIFWQDAETLLLSTDTGANKRLSVSAGVLVQGPLVTPISPATGQSLGWLTFVASPEGYPAIFAARADGSEMQQLSGDISPLFTDIYDPHIEDWSPDGKWIAYTGLPKDVEKDGSIYIAQLDEMESSDLIDSQSMVGDPDWSSDGEQIAYFSAEPQWGNNSANLYMLSVGKQVSPTPVTNTPTFDREPAWSPDGSRIAYVSSRENQNGTDLFIISLVDSTIQRLTNDTAGETDTAWSPDGQWIAFVSDREGVPHIYLIDTAGTNLIQVTKNVPDISMVWNGSPIWSPDSKYIAYISNRDEKTGAYIARADGSGEWLVIELPIWEDSLFWGMPDL